MKTQFIIGLLAGLLVWSCSSDPAATETPDPSDPALSPETVVRQWQSHIDKNEFDAAIALSDSGTIAWIETIRALTAAFPADSSVMTTEFISIQCQATGKQATCACILQDVELNTRYPDTFDLVQQNGKWLVTLPPGALDDTSDVLEELFKEMEREDILQ